MDDIWSRQEIDSPCVKICVVHPRAKICIGCFRTTDEISKWNRMSDTDRLALKQVLPERESLLREGRRGGRRSRRDNTG